MVYSRPLLAAGSASWAFSGSPWTSWGIRSPVPSALTEVRYQPSGACIRNASRPIAFDVGRIWVTPDGASYVRVWRREPGANRSMRESEATPTTSAPLPSAPVDAVPIAAGPFTGLPRVERTSVAPVLLPAGTLNSRILRRPSGGPASSQRSPFALAAPLPCSGIEPLARGRTLRDAPIADSTVDWPTR